MTSRIQPAALAIALAAALSAAIVAGRTPEPAATATATAAATTTKENLGRIDFPTSATGAAREHFVRGVLLLHSFMYDDAADEFAAAQKADPGFALAYWGEAMTQNHPLWMQRDADAARKILARLAPTREARLRKAATKRERGYLNAVEELYAEGEKRERDAAYAEAMGKLHEDFPDDLEAQSFYALALLGSCEDQRDFAVYMRGAALAEEVFARNPAHPGAVHYLIHAYDDPVHAPLGLRPARVYAKIAGAASHALHMPSHIFLALGMWDDVIASNEASWKAADERVARRKLGTSERGWHAIYWLEYAFLQEGRVREAKALVRIAEADAANGTDRVKNARNEMRATYDVETGCADRMSPAEAAATEKSPRDGFVRGYCSWKQGDLAGVTAALAALGKASSESSDPSAHGHGGPAPAYGSPKAPLAAVFRLELEALELAGRVDREGAIARARQAAAAEDAMSFEFGPPAVVKPAHELLGELLLAARKPDEAAKEFAVALARAPGRGLSLFGEMRAASEARDTKTLDAANRVWQQNHRNADDKSLSPKNGDAPRETGANR